MQLFILSGIDYDKEITKSFQKDKTFAVMLCTDIVWMKLMNITIGQYAFLRVIDNNGRDDRYETYCVGNFIGLIRAVCDDYDNLDTIKRSVSKTGICRQL